MAADQVTGTSRFGLPIVTAEGKSRVLVEHGDGRWSLVLINDFLKKRFPDRPVDPECTFAMDDLIDTAMMAFSGNPKITEDKHAGRKLAAGVLMFATACKIIDLKEPET